MTRTKSNERPWWEDPAAIDEWNRRNRGLTIVPAVPVPNERTEDRPVFDIDDDAFNGGPTWGPERGDA